MCILFFIYITFKWTSPLFLHTSVSFILTWLDTAFALILEVQLGPLLKTKTPQQMCMSSPCLPVLRSKKALSLQGRQKAHDLAFATLRVMFSLSATTPAAQSAFLWGNQGSFTVSCIVLYCDEEGMPGLMHCYALKVSAEESSAYMCAKSVHISEYVMSRRDLKITGIGLVFPDDVRTAIANISLMYSKLLMSPCKVNFIKLLKNRQGFSNIVLCHGLEWLALFVCYRIPL